MTEQERKTLEDFLLHIDCLDALSNWQENHFNVFDVLKISRNEIRHSNVLAWLLNANANHNLGDSFFSGVIHRLLKNGIKGQTVDTAQLLLLNLYSFEIKRETDNIDLFLVSDSEKYVIVIENKIGSGEHSNQLKRYQNTIEKKYSHYKKIYVFLTPGGQSASDEDNWTTLTYQDVYDALIEAIEKRDPSEQIQSFLENYLDVLRRDVMGDKELKEVCNKIYQKYKTAIDLIVNNSDMDSTKGQMLNGIKKLLNEYKEAGTIIYSDGTTFYTKEMDEVIPGFDEPISSWRTTRMYANWFEVWDDIITIHLELGGNNLSPEQDRIVDQLMALTKPHTKSKPFTWKRLINNKKQLRDAENDVEQQSYQIAKELLDQLLAEENKIYQDLKQRA